MMDAVQWDVNKRVSIRRIGVEISLPAWLLWGSERSGPRILGIRRRCGLKHLSEPSYRLLACLIELCDWSLAKMNVVQTVVFLWLGWGMLVS